MYALCIIHSMHTLHKKFIYQLTRAEGQPYNWKRKRTRPTEAGQKETEAETMANKLEPLTVDTAERLDDAKAGIDALELMTDAFLLGNEEYDPQETAEAMHREIGRTHV